MKVIHTFSFKSFIVSVLTFRFLIHFELFYIWYELVCEYPVIPAPFVDKIILSPLNCLALFLKITWLLLCVKHGSSFPLLLGRPPFCGQPCSTESAIVWSMCHLSDTINTVSVPYGFWYFTVELAAMNIKVKLFYRLFGSGDLSGDLNVTLYTLVQWRCDKVTLNFLQGC